MPQKGGIETRKLPKVQNSKEKPPYPNPHLKRSGANYRATGAKSAIAAAIDENAKSNKLPAITNSPPKKSAEEIEKEKAEAEKRAAEEAEAARAKAE